ncbi:MAG: uroporphyrinogen decarboxylase family protein [Eubacteriales bacterium]|nr:uroporphyrinogen decarboxylase family protein [Eubacteriales bacterium]
MAKTWGACMRLPGGVVRYVDMDMDKWLEDIKSSETKKPMPILSFPGIQLIGAGVDDLVKDGGLQAKCLKALGDRYDMPATVTFMDLSVEAEAFGSPIRLSDDEVPPVLSNILKTDKDIDNLKIPAVGGARTGEYIKGVAEAKKLMPNKPVFAGAIGPFSLAGRLSGMTEIMIKSMTEPDSVIKVLEKCTAFLMEYIGAFKNAGADGVIIAEPAAGLLSPRLNAEFSVPYNRRIVDAVQDESFIVIYHNCGNVGPLIGDILAIGAKVLHFGNTANMEEILPQIPPDIVVMGNIDPASEFRQGTPESIAAATKALLTKCSKFSNFVLSSGCDIPPQSPLANISAFFSAADSFYV